MLEGLRLERVEISKLLGKKLEENNYKLAVTESITGSAHLRTTLFQLVGHRGILLAVSSRTRTR